MNDDKTQESPVALITGGARRVGAGIAKCLHQAGFSIVVHCNNSLNEATKLVEMLNQERIGSAYVLQANLLSQEEACKLVSDTIALSGQLDLLVNNASIFIKNECLMTVNNDLWQKMFTTNVQAPMWLSTAAYPHLVKQQGAIVNITDTHSDKPLKEYSTYCQTKAALTMQTKSLALEFAPDIRVNAVAPGAVSWPEHDNALSDEVKQQVIQKTPLKRHGDPQFIAQAVLSLAQNRFITGQTLRVDGGRFM